MRDNSQKYLTVLSDEEIEMIETLCEPLMIELGYKPISECKWVQPKRFIMNDEKRAKKKKKEMDEWIRVNMPLLVEKYEYIATLEERLKLDFPLRSAEGCVGFNNYRNVIGGIRKKVAAMFSKAF